MKNAWKLDIGCLNIRGTHTIANNSTDNNVVFIYVSDWKLYTITTIIPWSQCLGKERENILCHYLFGDKLIQNCLKKDATN